MDTAGQGLLMQHGAELSLFMPVVAAAAAVGGGRGMTRLVAHSWWTDVAAACIV